MRLSCRILIVDDHHMMRDGLRLILDHHPGAEIVGACGGYATAWQLVGELNPDIVLASVDLPDGCGVALTRRIRAEFPAVKVLLLDATLERGTAVRAIAAGAHGYLAKTSGAVEFLAALRTIARGGTYFAAEVLADQTQLRLASTVAAEKVRQVLPLREGQVLILVVRGLRNKEIGEELGLNVKTVETYRGRLMKRFDCSSPAELVRHAIRLGLAVA